MRYFQSQRRRYCGTTKSITTATTNLLSMIFATFLLRYTHRTSHALQIRIQISRPYHATDSFLPISNTYHQRLSHQPQLQPSITSKRTIATANKYQNIRRQYQKCNDVDDNDDMNSHLLDDWLNDVLKNSDKNGDDNDDGHDVIAFNVRRAATTTTTFGTSSPSPSQLDVNSHHKNSESCMNGWRCINWDMTTTNTSKTTTPPPPSPVDMVVIRDRLVYIKRDDQTRLSGSQISGNKGRKMWSLQCMNSTSFPSCVVSYGGPQSNSMLAIAAVVQYHNTRLFEQLHQPTNDGDQSFNTIDDVVNDVDVVDDDDNDDDERYVSPITTFPNESFRRRRFIYYTKKLPSFLRNQPSGNLFRALSLGMELVEVSNDEYNNLFASVDNTFVDHVAPLQLPPPVYNDSVWIPQGGACGMALSGTTRLAQEIYDYWYQHGNHQPLSVCIPGGTCSTALFVHRALQTIQASKPIEEQMDIEVVVIPCVGDEAYAQRQMINLNKQIFGNDEHDRTNRNNIPTILRPIPLDGLMDTASRRVDGKYNNYDTSKGTNYDDYYRFGAPHADILQTFREFRDEYDILIDLLYGASAWTILLRHWTSSSQTVTVSDNNEKKFNPNAPLVERRIMYVHSGGVEGINSQLLRYKHFNLVDMEEIQLPGRDARYPTATTTTTNAGSLSSGSSTAVTTRTST